MVELRIFHLQVPLLAQGSCSQPSSWKTSWRRHWRVPVISPWLMRNQPRMLKLASDLRSSAAFVVLFGYFWSPNSENLPSRASRFVWTSSPEPSIPQPPRALSWSCSEPPLVWPQDPTPTEHPRTVLACSYWPFDDLCCSFYSDYVNSFNFKFDIWK